MSKFRQKTVVKAPLSEVWEFHSTGNGLKVITPNWMNLKIESIINPRNSEKDILEKNSEIKISINPFGVGPKQRWTSVITKREKREEKAVFIDEMKEGFFKKWRHKHKFEKVENGTLICDEIEYELPFSAVGKIFYPLSLIGMKIMFIWRHKKTKKVLEDI